MFPDNHTPQKVLDSKGNIRYTFASCLLLTTLITVTVNTVVLYCLYLCSLEERISQVRVGMSQGVWAERTAFLKQKRQPTSRVLQSESRRWAPRSILYASMRFPTGPGPPYRQRQSALCPESNRGQLWRKTPAFTCCDLLVISTPSPPYTPPHFHSHLDALTIGAYLHIK